MPNWKKIIVSGSDASLNNLNVGNSVTASFFKGDGSQITGIIANVIGSSNNVTLSADYTALPNIYNSLFGPLYVEDDVSVTVEDGSFLRIENFTPEQQISSSHSETASYFGGEVKNAISASYVENAISASYVENAISASYVKNSESSSFSLLSSKSINNNASSGSLSFWQGSQSEYNLISASADNSTIYFIT